MSGLVVGSWLLVAGTTCTLTTVGITGSSVPDKWVSKAETQITWSLEMGNGRWEMGRILPCTAPSTDVDSMPLEGWSHGTSTRVQRYTSLGTEKVSTD